MADLDNALSDQELVQKIGSHLVEEADSGNIQSKTKAMQLFFDVYIFDLEIGSGASFDQYFQWANCEDAKRIVSQLKEIKLETIAVLAENAITAIFPDGIPSDEDDYDDCMELSEEQEELLENLYEQEEDIHLLIEKALADLARDNDLVSQIN